MLSPDELLEALDLPGALVVGAGWTDGLRDFQLELADGRALLFEDCLQVSFHRGALANEPLAIGGWWTDEPSPLLASLPPEVRFLYRHIVFEIGEGLLRVACRSVQAATLGA